MFVKDSMICNYTDATSICVNDRNHHDIIGMFENDISTMASWFRSNFRKLNGDKCHLVIFSKQNSTLSMNIGRNIITESQEEKLLGITLDKTLSFKLHL